MADSILFMAVWLAGALTVFAYMLTKMKQNEERLLQRQERRLKEMETYADKIMGEAKQLKEDMKNKTSTRSARDKDFEIVAEHVAEPTSP
ncbi:hypothetical protein KJ765_00755 [Candidatus Micrarchaeota archaeon]|nr:hypothetical protein [Candidatus Micrarchaeota archaeon]